MNAEKHERSLLKVVSDAGSTPAASTKCNHNGLMDPIQKLASPEQTYKATIV